MVSEFDRCVLNCCIAFGDYKIMLKKSCINYYGPKEEERTIEHLNKLDSGAEFLFEIQKTNSQ